MSNLDDNYEVCLFCRGIGYVDNTRCSTCDGNGRVFIGKKRTKPIKLNSAMDAAMREARKQASQSWEHDPYGD